MRQDGGNLDLEITLPTIFTTQKSLSISKPRNLQIRQFKGTLLPQNMETSCTTVSHQEATHRQ